MDIISKEELHEYLLNKQQDGKTCIQALVELANRYNREEDALKE